MNCCLLLVLFLSFNQYHLLGCLIWYILKTPENPCETGSVLLVQIAEDV